MIQRLLPFLNKLVPTALAVKGLGKIDPRLEKFFGAAAASGYTADAAMDFVRNKLEGKTEANIAEEQRLDQGMARGTLRPDEAASRAMMQESNRVPNALQNVATIGAGLGGGLAALAGGAPEEEQPVAQQEQQPSMQGPGGLNSQFILKHPELGSYLDNLMKQGASPEQAAMQAKSSRRFAPSIAEIEQSMGTDFVSLIKQLFYGNQQQQGSGVGSAIDQLKQAINQYQQFKRGK